MSDLDERPVPKFLQDVHPFPPTGAWVKILAGPHLGKTGYVMGSDCSSMEVRGGSSGQWFTSHLYAPHQFEVLQQVPHVTHPGNPMVQTEVKDDDVEHVTTLCLDAARAAVMGDRARDYGRPSENHARTAALWSAYLGVEISARQVCLMNILQKVSRDAHSPKQDNLVDVAGYAQNAAWMGA